MEGYQMAPYFSRALMKHFSERYICDKAGSVSATYLDDPAYFTVRYKDIRIALRMGRDGIFYEIGDFFRGCYAPFFREDDAEDLLAKLISDMELMLYEVPYFEHSLIREQRNSNQTKIKRPKTSLKYRKDFKKALYCFVGYKELPDPNFMTGGYFDDYDF